MFTKDRLRINCENKRPPDVSLILGRNLQTRTRWRLIPARKQQNSCLLSFPFQHKPSKLLPNPCCIQLATRTVVFLWKLSDHLKLEDWCPQPPRDVSSLKGWEGYSQHCISLLMATREYVLSTSSPLAMQTALCTTVSVGSGDNH